MSDTQHSSAEKHESSIKIFGWDLTEFNALAQLNNPHDTTNYCNQYYKYRPSLCSNINGFIVPNVNPIVSTTLLNDSTPNTTPNTTPQGSPRASSQHSTPIITEQIQKHQSLPPIDPKILQSINLPKNELIEQNTHDQMQINQNVDYNIVLLNFLESIIDETSVVCLQEVSEAALASIENKFSETYDILHYKQTNKNPKKLNKIHPSPQYRKFLVIIINKELYNTQEVEFTTYKCGVDSLTVKINNTLVVNGKFPFKKESDTVIKYILETSKVTNAIIVGNANILRTEFKESFMTDSYKINIAKLEDEVDHNDFDKDRHKHVDNIGLYGDINILKTEVYQCEELPNDFIICVIIKHKKPSKVINCLHKSFLCAKIYGKKASPIVMPIIKTVLHL